MMISLSFREYSAFLRIQTDLYMYHSDVTNSTKSYDYVICLT